MSTKQSVLVTGATGQQGGAVADGFEVGTAPAISQACQFFQ